MPWKSAWFWLIAAGFTFMTGLVAGSYPALYLSGFKPVKILKGSFKAGNFTFLFRRVLVILQFTVSITLSIGTIVVYRQIQYAKDRPAGYSVRGLLTVPINAPELSNHFGVIRNELISTGAVMNMAESSYPTTHFDSENGIDWEGRDPNRNRIQECECIAGFWQNYWVEHCKRPGFFKGLWFGFNRCYPE